MAEFEVVVVAEPQAAQGRGLKTALELAETRDGTGGLERILRGTGDGGQREFHRAVGDERAVRALTEELNADRDVQAAYFKPEATPPASPSFFSKQGHLRSAAEGGLDAEYAWKLPGGYGNNVRVIDIEGGWNRDHEDLQNPRVGLIGGSAYTDKAVWEDHGTAVLGIIRASHNGFGVNGFAPDATVSVVSHKDRGSAQAIRLAADNLRSRDLLLLEMHRPGPRYNYQSRDDQLGFIAVEWWPDDYEAIKYATNKGVIVVACAGNGNQNFDDSLYDQRPNSSTVRFPSTWTNPFNRKTSDSGSILVGAGNPPDNYGNDGPARSRASFSNYGGALDTSAWGWSVTTTGYGALQGGDENRQYTDGFGGTSSAGAVVTGALASYYGALRAAGKTLPSYGDLRSKLRSTGGAQTAATSRPTTQRIGALLNLPQLLTVSGIAPLAPTITAFSASPSSYLRGGSTVLSWTTSGPVTQLVIDQGVGSVTGTNSRTVNPTTTQTYTLTAYNGTSSTSRSVTVTVTQPQPPTISSFTASPVSFEVGKTTTLSWNVSGTVTRLSIDQGVGDVTGLSTTVAPTSSRTYTLTAYNGTVSSSKTVPVTVTQPVAPTITAFTVTPTSFETPGSASLSWAVSGATTALQIDQGVGNVLNRSNAAVSPTATTTYTITAYNGLSFSTKTVTLTVTQPVKPTIQSFTATPEGFQYPGGTLLEWAVSGKVTALTIDQGIGSVLGKTTLNVTPTTTTTYTLTVINNGVSTTRQLTVTVTQPAAPSIVAFTATPNLLIEGEGKSSTLAWSLTGDVTLVTIDQGVGSVTGLSEFVVSPTTTTTYTLSAFNGTERRTKSIAVTVGPPGVKPVTPDFSSLELHYGDAPGQLDMNYAYSFAGGKGDGVTLIALDTGFGPHEDLATLPQIVAGGSLQATATPADKRHGTMTLGLVNAQHNGLGFNGFAPNAVVKAACVRYNDYAATIKACADLLNPGDIIYGAIQIGGPNYVSGAGVLGTRGTLPPEWWPEGYEAIKYATDKGILFVGAAGNGEGSLDLPDYDTPPSGAPAWWSNPLRRTALDAGSIMVGAAAPTTGVRGSTWGPLGSRLDYSNYGSAVDVSAWGREVAFLASYNYEVPPKPGNYYYTGGTGTSVATPLVAGVLASLQGALKAAGLPLLTPATARAALRATGLPQTAAPGRPATERIGNLIDVAALYRYAGLERTAPDVTEFRADPEAVLVGEPVTLSWQIDGYLTALTLEGIGDVFAQESVTVTPTEDTTYTLNAFNGTEVTSVQLTVFTAELPPPEAPEISLFTASPGTLIAGTPREATLSWDISGPYTALTLEGIGDVTDQTRTKLKPAETTLYTLTAFNGEASARTTIQVAVVPPTPPEPDPAPTPPEPEKEVTTLKADPHAAHNVGSTPTMKLEVAAEVRASVQTDVISQASLNLVVAANLLSFAASELDAQGVQDEVSRTAEFMRRTATALGAANVDELLKLGRITASGVGLASPDAPNAVNVRLTGSVESRLATAFASLALEPPDPDIATALPLWTEFHAQVKLSGSFYAQLALPLADTVMNLASFAEFRGEPWAMSVLLPLTQQVAFSGVLKKETVEYRRLELIYGWGAHAQARARGYAALAPGVGGLELTVSAEVGS